MPRGLDALFQSRDGLAFCGLQYSNVRQVVQEYSTLLSITYAFRPRLRGRLTLGGLTFPRKPWVFGGSVLNRPYRYLYRHNHFYSVHRSFRYGFDQNKTLLYHSSTSRRTRRIRSFGNELEPRSFSAQNHSTSELLRTL